MEHLDTGTRDDWYANRAQPLPTLLQRLAVIAPDDAPGLSALRQRLAQRGPRSLNCDHFAAGFNGAASAGLASAFEQIRQRHATDPYDIVLLLEGRPEALGIAESNGLIPEQVSRMPVPVWTAIGEDDANTELGDVANRVFSNPVALIDALLLQAAPNQASAAVSPPEPVRQSAAAPVLSLVTTSNDAAPAHFPALPSRHAALPPPRTSAHPLVLCAAGAVIIASMTAMAAMLGWLPSRVQANAGVSDRPVTTVTGRPAASPAVAKVVDAVDPMPSPPAANIPEALPDPATLPSAPATPQSSGIGENTALMAAGAAGLIAAAPRTQAALPAPAKRTRRSPHRPAVAASTQAQAQAQAPRQVGSTEVPVLEFVGTKSRQQVIAEMMEARRAANRQAANGNYFPGLGGTAARR